MITKLQRIVCDWLSTDGVMFLGGLMQTGAEYIQIYGNEYRVR